MAEAGDLYENDFYLWTQAQAEALRARGRGDNRLDWDRLAEEIEDMGKSDLRECFSRCERIIEHLFKLAWSAHEAPRAGWEETIERERLDLELALTAALRRQVEESLEQRHLRALRLARKSFAREEPDTPIDAALRWSLAQILGEEDDPLA